MVFLRIPQGVCHAQQLPVGPILIPGGIAFPVHGAGDVSRVVIAVELAAAVRPLYLHNPAPFVQFIPCPVGLAVHDAGDVSRRVVFILLGGTR